MLRADDGTISEIVKENEKARKAEYLKDLEEIGKLCGMAAEYINQALIVCVRRTHVLGAGGITDLMSAAEMMYNYQNASEQLTEKVRAGKVKTNVKLSHARMD